MSLEHWKPGARGEHTDINGMITNLNLGGRLGIIEPVDETFLSLCLYARLLRNPSSRRANLLADPRIPFLKDVFIMGHVIKSLEKSEEAHQKAVDEIEVKLQEFILKHYPSPEAHNRARTIELAVNELVAKGLSRGNSMRRGKPTLQFDIEELNAWGEFWEPRITTPNPQ